MSYVLNTKYDYNNVGENNDGYWQRRQQGVSFHYNTIIRSVVVEHHHHHSYYKFQIWNVNKIPQPKIWLFFNYDRFAE